MTEAWFLFDEVAIRTAAGNPRGTMPLSLPPIERVEALPDPKAVLRDALLDASGLSGRRRDKFRAGQAFQRVAELIESYRALRVLPSFGYLESAIARACAARAATSR
jgi:hypothetical protein